MRPNLSLLNIAWLVMQMKSSVERTGGPGERIDRYLDVLADRLDRVRQALQISKNV
jgi:hypothetical protein